MDLVERLAQLGFLGVRELEADGHGSNVYDLVAHQLPFSARARAATFSGVKPKCLARSSYLPDSPKRSRPRTSPCGPTQRSQPKGRPASTARRRVTDGGSTASR